MNLKTLVGAIRVVELTAKTRAKAIHTLVAAANLDEEAITQEEVVEAIEEREAAAQTIVADGFALPHAVINWGGDYRVVLGRSRPGVEYGIPGSGRVHLIALVIVGRKHRQIHLELLAALAELLDSAEYRRTIVEARNLRVVEQLLRGTAGIEPKRRVRRLQRSPQLNRVLIEKAIDLVRLLNAQALLLAVDRVESLPWDALCAWTGPVLVVTSQKGGDFVPERPDTHLLEVPHATLTPVDRAHFGLLLATSTDLLNDESNVVCVTGAGGTDLDSVTVIRPAVHFKAMFAGRTTRRSARIQPAVMLRALSLAIELAAEGREARPIGTMFVIGDTRQVMRHTRQLVLNPFHGYARSLRSLLDRSLAETIKEFALLDGAFVVHADGTLLSAGTYVVPKASAARLPQGLGTRHQAAAAVTTHTQAMSIVVSQSTGTVTVFRNGQVVFMLERAAHPGLRRDTP
ncbi:MAG: diadenylate cyclase [Planctomycetota bacterium]